MRGPARWLGSPGPAVICLVLAVGCSSSTGPSPSPTPDPGPSADEVLVGAGDIALCGSPGAVATSALLDTIAGTIFTAGDNVYPGGSPVDFSQCYDPTWGRHLDRTFPVPGNHDYETPGAAGYFDYFGSAAGPRGRGYYTYNVGAWRVFALNSEILPDGRAASASAAAAQMQWLRGELAAKPAACTIAIWHRPLYSSGQNRPNPDTRELFRVLHEFNADIVINGHDHDYERFAPQDADGHLDTSRGIRQFVVGTGGVPPYTFFSRSANSESFQSDTWGVLKLTLSLNGYTWDYVPIPGRGGRDSGSGVCH